MLTFNQNFDHKNINLINFDLKTKELRNFDRF